MIIRTEVDKDMHRRFKLACIERDQSMQGVLLELVQKYVEDHERRKEKAAKK